MKIGFIGTGDITKAIVLGLDRSDYTSDEIVVSKRSAHNSAMLAETCARVRVCDDNQQIVDEVDMVVLAVLPRVAEEEIAKLRFRQGQIVVTLIAMLTPERLAEWTGRDVEIVSATPLPFVADLIGPTLVRPDHPEVTRLFNALGRVIPVESEAEFDVLRASTTFMGAFFGLQEALLEWIADKVADPKAAREYVAAVLFGLAHTGVNETSTDLATLRKDHSTSGGLNEQMFRVFSEKGGVRAFIDAIDGVYERVRRAERSD